MSVTAGEATTVDFSDLPRIISIDDHIIEPPNLWADRLPERLRESGPRVERVFGYVDPVSRTWIIEDKDAPESRWCDQWTYEDMRVAMRAGDAAIGPLKEMLGGLTAVTYEDMEPGCYEQSARLVDMDKNHTDVHMCFPHVTRFCGQMFLERRDKELSLLCLRIYNDWILEEWCAGPGRGRLIPQTVVPLWDPLLAAEEVRRCAEKGAAAITFSECPPYLGLPSIHSGHWDPLFSACNDLDVVINMHIGSSSTLPKTSSDAPHLVQIALTSQNSQGAFVDWILSGALVRFPKLRIALSEGQVGWMPFMMERMDKAWARGVQYERNLYERLPDPPSSYVAGRVYGCLFDDLSGLEGRHTVGMSQLMFETDYPHVDSTFPKSGEVAKKLVTEAGLDEKETYQLLRGNAIDCYQLGRYGVES